MSAVYYHSLLAPHTICNLQDAMTHLGSLSYLRRDTHSLSISNLRSRCSLRKQLHKSISNPITETSRHYSSQMQPRTDSKCLLFPSPPPPHFRYCAIFLSPLTRLCMYVWVCVSRVIRCLDMGRYSVNKTKYSKLHLTYKRSYKKPET